jgi:hypothetical protein
MINGNLILYFYQQTPLIVLPSKLCWTISGETEWVLQPCAESDTWTLESCETDCSSC